MYTHTHNHVYSHAPARTRMEKAKVNRIFLLSELVGLIEELALSEERWSERVCEDGTNFSHKVLVKQGWCREVRVSNGSL
jgi:hypothetical protein